MAVDIAIIGSGFSGVNLAHALVPKGYSVSLIDRRKSCPDIFRAEKIEAEQADIMRRLGTFDFRSPKSDPIGAIKNARPGVVDEFDGDEQYGISYSETVNSLSDNLPQSVNTINNTVTKIHNSDKIQTIYFSDDSTLEAKLIVVATGGNNKLMKSLGIKRRFDKKLKSLNFGFDIERADGADFDFNGFNYFLSKSVHSVNYITIFPIGSRMRVNLFTQLNLKDKLTGELRNNTLHALHLCFPDLYKHIGEIKVISSVQVMPTHYYRLKNQVRPGLVIIGDEFQSVNPATGSGLSKVLTDIITLSEKYIPAWLQSGNMAKKNIAAYYKDKDKILADTSSLSSWIYYYHDLQTSKIPTHERITHKLKLQGWY